MSELTDFIQRKTVQARTKAKTDWDERKAWWNKQLVALFDTVEGWLNGLDMISIHRNVVKIEEDGPGKYESPSIDIDIGGELVSFVPVGMSVIGSYGRVDLQGTQGSIPLVLLGKGCFPGVKYVVAMEKINTFTARTSLRDVSGKEVVPDNPEWYFFDRSGVQPSYLELTEDNLGIALERVMSHVDD